MMDQQTSARTSRVRLELYASKLKNVAGAFKGTSDPYAVATLLADGPNDRPQVLGRTEVVKNSLHPKWTAHFDIEYRIGCMTRINVGVYDEIRKGTNKPMGSAMFEVGEVLGTRGNIKAKKLRPGGTLYARITAAPPTTDVAPETLHLAFRGHKLANVDRLFGGKSDPFFEVLAKIDSAGGGLTWQPVYRSQHVLNNLNPQWEPFAVNVSRLCGGDRNRPVQIKVLDWQKSGRHVEIGHSETTVNGLLAAQVGGSSGGGRNIDTSKAFVLKKRAQQISGHLVVVSATIDGASRSNNVGSNAYADPGGFSSSMPAAMPPPSAAAAGMYSALSASAPAVPAAYMPDAPLPPPLPPPVAPPTMSTMIRGPPISMMMPAKPKPTFVDYLSGGLELELGIAIDFTGSNGDPRQPGTLHFIHPDGQLNDYEKAVIAVGAIVARYDSNQRFPVWGFGAKFGGQIQHCFQVGPESELHGLSGVLEGYRNVFRTGLTMSGPTVFAEVIGLAAAKAQSHQEASRRIGKQAYGILMILTDGAVTDVNLTKQAIEAASVAPLSIVIVGIGNADFGAMKFLDDFHQVNGGRGRRDICQFVEFSKYKDDKRALTRETLAEIPDQLVGYFYERGIMPLPPISGSQLSLAGSEPDEADVDLNLTFTEDGEISLANYNGAVFDDTQYGTVNSYEPTAPYQPGASGPPVPAPAPVPYQPTQYQQQAPPQVYQPTQQSSHTQQPQPYRPAVNPPAPPPPQQQQQRLLHVQVPPGSYPGSQVRVQNPTTGQMLVVTVPRGVAPGGKFAVQY